MLHSCEHVLHIDIFPFDLGTVFSFYLYEHQYTKAIISFHAAWQVPGQEPAPRSLGYCSTP